MSKHNKMCHCDAEHSIKDEKEKVEEMRKEEEKMARNIKSHEKNCGK